MNMKVYEMIQELARYDAAMEVEVNIYAKDYSTSATVQEGAEDGDEVEVKLDIDEDISDFDIQEYVPYRRYKKVRLNIELS